MFRGYLGVRARRGSAVMLAVAGLAAVLALACAPASALASGRSFAGRKCLLRVRWEAVGGTVLTDTCANYVHEIALCATGNDTSNEVRSAGKQFVIKNWQSFATACEDSAGEAPPTDLYYRTPDGNWHLIASSGPYGSVDKVYTIHFTE